MLSAARVRIHPHTPYEDVIRAAKPLGGIDGVVTIGGGWV
jgi:hypothetical protein